MALASASRRAFSSRFFASSLAFSASAAACMAAIFSASSALAASLSARADSLALADSSARRASSALTFSASMRFAFAASNASSFASASASSAAARAASADSSGAEDAPGWVDADGVGSASGAAGAAGAAGAGRAGVPAPSSPSPGAPVRPPLYRMYVSFPTLARMSRSMSSDLSPVALRPFSRHIGASSSIVLTANSRRMAATRSNSSPPRPSTRSGLKAATETSRGRADRGSVARVARIFFFIPRMVDDSDARLDAIDLAPRDAPDRAVAGAFARGARRAEFADIVSGSARGSVTFAARCPVWRTRPPPAENPPLRAGFQKKGCFPGLRIGSRRDQP